MRRKRVNLIEKNGCLQIRMRFLLEKNRNIQYKFRKDGK